MALIPGMPVASICSALQLASNFLWLGTFLTTQTSNVPTLPPAGFDTSSKELCDLCLFLVRFHGADWIAALLLWLSSCCHVSLPLTNSLC